MELPPQGEDETSNKCLDKVFNVFQEMDVHVPNTVIDQRGHQSLQARPPSK